MREFVLLFGLLSAGSALAGDLCMELFVATPVGTEIRVGSEFVADGLLEVPFLTDIHGNLDGLYSAVSELQVLRQRVFPVVFVTGDLGFFPDPSRLNKVTRLRELATAVEQSLGDYYASSSLHHKYFVAAKGMRKLAAKIYFIRGNHEDQTLLDDISERWPRQIIQVDDRRVLHYLTDGSLISLQVEGFRKSLLIASVGGIHQSNKPNTPPVDPLNGFHLARIDSLLRDLGTSNRKVDLLLTHQGINNFQRGKKQVDALIEYISPRVHICGHGHRCDGPAPVGRSTSFQLNALDKISEPDPTDGSALLVDLKSDGTLDAIYKLQ